MHPFLFCFLRHTGMVVVLLGLWAGTAWAETWYVKTSPTPMTVEPSGRSRTVGNLSAGQAVNVIGESGRYYKISVGGKEGYVFKFKLTQTAPAGKSGGGGDGLGSLLGNQKMAASESSSASSIRGLSPISEQYGQSQGISKDNIAAVKQMENFQVSPQDVERFQQEGALGPYAK